MKARAGAIVACLCGAVVLPGCAATAMRVSQIPARSGELVVYSATFAPTVEQSEYPVHTDYTIATTNGIVMERIANRTGPFGASAVKVALPEGSYQVRAQYEGGQFIVVPVVIQAGKTTTIHLTGGPLPQGTDATRQPVRLPDGAVVGWSETGDGPK